MTWVDDQRFTVFVLVVCIVLSFVLRQLIREISQMRQMIHTSLLQFTGALVQQNPTLENYLKLGLLYFQNRDYQSAADYFRKLVKESVYAKEAGYYLILCLTETGKTAEARQILASLNKDLYSKKEYSHLQDVISHPPVLLTIRNFFLRILLTEFSLRYPLLGETPSSATARRIEKMLAALPTRYRNPDLKSEHELFFEFEALDEHLQRRISLRVSREQLTEEQKEKFLEHPRILAQFHSRSFPQVYDLQQGSICYYSQELPAGESFHDVLSRTGFDGRPEEFLRCFLAMIRPLWHLELNGFGISHLDLSHILFNPVRESFCIFCLLQPSSPRQHLGLLQELQILLRREVQKRPDLPVAARLEGLESQSLTQFLEELQSCLEEHLITKSANRQKLVRELLDIEALHRASVHGLKGKFGIVKRYQNDASGLMRSFFRSQNISDIKDKILDLKQHILQLSESSGSGNYSILEELNSIDFESILQKLSNLSALYATTPEDPRLHEFLRTQFLLFESLSDALAEFIERHSIRLSSLIAEFSSRFVEKDRIETIFQSVSEDTKLTLISPEEMRQDLLIILENLCHNALEAKATRIEFLISRPDPQKVRFEVRDNGQGFPQEMLQEPAAGGSLGVQRGSTGLMSSRALCEGLGGSLQLDAGSSGGASVLLELPCFVA